jgi:hypothetical protein
MPGNKKPRRQRTGLRTNSVEAREHAYLKGARQREALRTKARSRHDKRNSLPLAHPVNAHMIDQTYEPLERHLIEHEKTGTVLTDADNGAPMFYDGRDLVSIIPAMLHMCFIFENIARAREWPAMPQGLRVYTVGLQFGRPIDADDFAGARETIAWMRKQLGTLTPTEWTELFKWAITLDGGELEPGYSAKERNP